MDSDHGWKQKLNQYNGYKKYLAFLNACSGVWPDYEGYPRAASVFLRFYSAIVSAFAFYCMLMFDFTEAASIKTFTRGLGLMIAFLSTFIKVCLLTKFQNDLRYLNSNVSASFERDIKDPQLRSHAWKHFPTFYNLMFLYTFFIVTTLSVMAFTPLYFASKGKYIRMYPQSLPFQVEPGSARHWIMYAVELNSSFYIFCTSSGTDLLFGFYSLHIASELRVLSHCFQNLKSSKDYKKNLKECVRRHLMIIDSMPVLQKIFGFMSVWLAITCAIAICTLIFQFSQMKTVTTLKTCYLIAHVFAKLVQSFTYAWYGNIITIESENCIQAVYESSWPGSGDVKLMKDITIVSAQRPLIFNAIHFMYLGLDMFSKIVNTSVSYYFLLKTLEEKQM